MEELPLDFKKMAGELSSFSRILHQKGFAEANGGNLSVRVAGGMILSTPTMMSKGDVTPSDIVLCNMNGEQIYGTRPVSSELLSHLAIYKANPQINAVIHSHPPYCCSYAFTNENPFEPLSPESIIWLGKVAIIDFEIPGTPALSEKLSLHSTSSLAFLLRNHGIITCGGTLQEAMWRSEIMERQCLAMHLIGCRGSSPVQLTVAQLELMNLIKSNYIK